MKKIILRSIFIIFLIAPILGFGQTHKLSGTVTAFGKFPLRNITVKAKKAKTEVKTDDQGNFEIEVMKKDLISIRNDVFVEYSKKVSNSDKVLKINLIIRNDDRNMQKAVEEGFIAGEDLDYGRKNLAHLNSEFNRFNDVFEAIKYAVPESTIIVENGRRGVQLRGPKTFLGSNFALLIVNGVIVDDVSFIIPGDILRINKLENSKSALYGARAGNGIINIETR